MDFLLAKIKRISNPAHSKVMSNHTTYDFDLNQFSFLEYAPDHNLDEDCLFKVSNFSSKEFCLDFLRSDITSANFNQITSDRFKKISYLCAVQSDTVCFQKVTPSTYLNRSILKLGEMVTVEENQTGIFISAFPDAVYIRSLDILVFRNLSAISSIFKGIDTLFREATQEEVERFLSEGFIDLSENYDSSKVSKLNRKRIALAMESLSHLSSREKDQIMDYIHTYCENIPYSSREKSFSISTDNDLKYFLYGMEQRFYTTLLGDEKRLANSVQRLG